MFFDSTGLAVVSFVDYIKAQGGTVKSTGKGTVSVTVNNQTSNWTLNSGIMDDTIINERFGFSSFLTDLDRESGVEIAILDGKLYHDVTNKLNALMADAESKYAYWNTGDVFIDYPTFYNLVRNKGPYDLKNQPDWQHDLFVYNNMIIRKDVPGNMLFGYLGKAMGIQEHVLLAGAGFAQMQAGTSTWWWPLASYGDDPNDQYWIDYGFRTFRAKHGSTVLDYIGDAFKIYW